MQVPFVNLAAEYGSMRESLLEAFDEVGRSGHYVLGPQGEALEKSFAQLCSSRFAVAVGNGSDALMLPLLTLELQPDEEVITAPNSFVASAWVIARAGARIRFCDVDDSMNIDPVALAAAITPQTRAVMPVHLTGRIAAMEKIMPLAQSRSLRVIEDAAQAVLARRHGQSAGSFGWCAGFSLHPLKNLHVYGDGGILTTDDEDLVQKIRKWRNHGLLNRDVCEFWGLNSRLDEGQAAILLRKLKLLAGWTERYQAIARRYCEALGGSLWVPSWEAYEEPVFHRFMVRHPERDALAQFLQQQGIETKVNYPIPLHLQPAARSLGYARGDFPMAEKLADTILSLPIYPALGDDQVDWVCEQVLEFCRQNPGNP